MCQCGHLPHVWSRPSTVGNQALPAECDALQLPIGVDISAEEAPAADAPGGALRGLKRRLRKVVVPGGAFWSDRGGRDHSRRRSQL
eukprot:157776-Chlamydomonas_euryale.AAC.4